MIIHSDRPLPMATDKRDKIGTVFSAIIMVNKARHGLKGTVAEYQEKLEVERRLAETKINTMVRDVRAELKVHTDKRGTVHGETQESVGLGEIKNYPLATPEIGVAGLSSTHYATPAGNKALINAKLGIDPGVYLKGGSIPFASGAMIGTVSTRLYSPYINDKLIPKPSWEYHKLMVTIPEKVGYEYNNFADTPWTFKTPDGVVTFSNLTWSDSFNGDPANSPLRTALPYSGTSVRSYTGKLDIRRNRPSFHRGYSLVNTNYLMKSEDRLFDKKAYYFFQTYGLDNRISVASLDKTELPFDQCLYKGNIAPDTKSLEGIVFSRETELYNLNSQFRIATLSGGPELGVGVVIEGLTFLPKDLQISEMVGGHYSQFVDNQRFHLVNNFTFEDPSKFSTVTIDGKSGFWVSLSGLLGVDKSNTGIIQYFDREIVRKITFTWVNRLAGICTIRIPIQFKSKDGTKFYNYYLDLQLKITYDPSTRTNTISVRSEKNLNVNLQQLDLNTITLSTAGNFKEYPASVANNPLHPAIMGGDFIETGGHMRCYTLWNRQYIGGYTHGARNPFEWIYYIGDLNVTKIQYRATSVINQDGLYGDHLRHIPMGSDAVSDYYLTQTRNHRHEYAWAIVGVEKDVPLIQSGDYMGPDRNSLSWVKFSRADIPSFLIEGDSNTKTQNVNGLVFNTQNKFVGFSNYTLDVNAATDPVTFGTAVNIDDKILSYIAKNAGSFFKNHRQMFLLDGSLFFFSQTIDPNEMVDGVDCYYGWIKNCSISTTAKGAVVQCSGEIVDNITIKPLKVNNPESLKINNKTIYGWDVYDAADIYAIKQNEAMTTIGYNILVNLAPFNNFYFEFKYTRNKSTGGMNFFPKTDAIDPVFPYDENLGFNVDYDKFINYGTKLPHRMHPNLQTPVMVGGACWSFRKTPNSIGIFSRSNNPGVTITDGRVLHAIKGTMIFPVGSFCSISGKTLPVKASVVARSKDYGLDDELFCRLENNQPYLYSLRNNPKGYPVEVYLSVLPVGFIKNGGFAHHDHNGFRTDMLPLVNYSRMNVFGYGSSSPIFLGKPGGKVPTNRYFIEYTNTTMTVNTAVGRIIPMIMDTWAGVWVNSVLQSYDGGPTFTIPASFTGTVTVEIRGMTTIKWFPGLVTLSTIGNNVNKLDFSGATQFSITAPLPKRISSLYRAFYGASAVSFPGIENWGVSNVSDFTETFANNPNFNQNLSAWRLKDWSNWNGPNTGMIYLTGTFDGCRAFNQPLKPWGFQGVKSMANFLRGCANFNQDMSNIDVRNVESFKGTFWGCSKLTTALTGWVTSSAIDFNDTFRECSLFNSPVNHLDMSKAKIVSGFLRDCLVFNQPVNGLNIENSIYSGGFLRGCKVFNQPVDQLNPVNAIELGYMFADTDMFDQPLTTWKTGNCTNFYRMFYNAKKFNRPLNNFNTSNVTDMTDMFNGALLFNQDLSMWDVRKVTQRVGFDAGASAWVLPRPNWVS